MARPSLTALAAACALVLPSLAHSRTLTLSATLAHYNGQGAYMAAYLTDAQGACAATLWVAGSKAKYYKHLSDWRRLCGNARLAGITGASVGPGRSLKVTADIADALIDAGYEIRIDAADEDQDDSPNDARLPLRSQAPAAPASGRRLVRTLDYRWQ